MEQYLKFTHTAFKIKVQNKQKEVCESVCICCPTCGQMKTQINFIFDRKVLTTYCRVCSNHFDSDHNVIEHKAGLKKLKLNDGSVQSFSDSAFIQEVLSFALFKLLYSKFSWFNLANVVSIYCRLRHMYMLYGYMLLRISHSGWVLNSVLLRVPTELLWHSQVSPVF